MLWFILLLHRFKLRLNDIELVELSDSDWITPNSTNAKLQTLCSCLRHTVLECITIDTMITNTVTHLIHSLTLFIYV